jgi:hypothetical protein
MHEVPGVSKSRAGEQALSCTQNKSGTLRIPQAITVLNPLVNVGNQICDQLMERLDDALEPTVANSTGHSAENLKPSSRRSWEVGSPVQNANSDLLAAV